jgi:hypothetical protein
MKISLEKPFSDNWKSGYLVTNSENRKNVILFNNNKERSTVSFARYLMSVHLGRYLEPSEHVDHIDNDKTNDIIGNLQILTPRENNIKYVRFSGKEAKLVIICCCNCEKDFTMRQSNFKSKLKNSKTRLFFCTKACQYDYFSKYKICVSNNRSGGILKSKEDISLIKELRKTGLSSYEINRRTGISRNTIMKYWK